MLGRLSHGAIRTLPTPLRRPLECELRHWSRGLEAARRTAPYAPRVPTALRLLLAPRLRMLCHPGNPSHWQALYKICALNGYRIVTDPAERYDLAVHFASGGACELPADGMVLNRACTDISKTHVAAVFERVFGYGLAVDPTAFDGPIVAKSDANYTHDGKLLHGPLRPGAVTDGRVYQRLVDTTDGDHVVDLRTPIYGGEVPFVYLKRRPLASRFANENTIVELAEADAVYTPAELDVLRKFAEAMALDYGELDVLRDNTDGRIYVVDVANTPAGPPNGTPPATAQAATRRLAARFAELVERQRQQWASRATPVLLILALSGCEPGVEPSVAAESRHGMHGAVMANMRPR